MFNLIIVITSKAVHLISYNAGTDPGYLERERYGALLILSHFSYIVNIL